MNENQPPFIRTLDELQVHQQVAALWESTTEASGTLVAAYVAADLLRHPDYNPRRLDKADEEQLAASLQKFGLTEPLPVNTHPGREGILIGGNQRVTVMLKHNLVAKGCFWGPGPQPGENRLFIPCILRSLDEEAEKELNLRLNRNQGKWDMGKLQLNFGEDMLKGIGFQSWELGGFGKSKAIPATAKPLPDPSAPKPEAKPAVPRQMVKYEIMLAPETRDRWLRLLDSVKAANGLETNDDAFIWINNQLLPDEQGDEQAAV